MKIIISEKSASWYGSLIYITPSLSIDYDKGYVDNLDIDRVQNTIEIDVHFSFLFLNLFIVFVIMWGDKGEIQEQTFKTKDR